MSTLIEDVACEIRDEIERQGNPRPAYLDFQSIARAAIDKYSPKRVVQMEAALLKFKTDMCEGWCDETDLIFADCQGCEARSALRSAPPAPAIDDGTSGGKDER